MDIQLDKINPREKMGLKDPWEIWQRLEDIKNHYLQNRGQCNIRELYSLAQEVKQVHAYIMVKSDYQDLKFDDKGKQRIAEIAADMLISNSWRKKPNIPRGIMAKDINLVVNELMTSLFKFLDFFKSTDFEESEQIAKKWTEKNRNEELENGFEFMYGNMSIIQEVYAMMEKILQKLWEMEEKRMEQINEQRTTLFEEIIKTNREDMLDLTEDNYQV
jgi:hypothetical protein